MAVETQPELAAPARRTWFRLLLNSGLVLVFAIITALLLLPEPSSTSLVLLAPGDFAKATRPGVLRQFKYKIARIVGPWLSRFRKSKPQIVLRATMMAIVGSDDPMRGFASLAATNDERTIAWVLSEAQTQIFLAQLRTNPAARSLNQSSIVTYDGGQATLSNGQTLAARGLVAWTGLQLEVLPKVSAHSIRLLVGANWSETSEVGGSPQSVRTNFSVTCSALLTNSSGLVLLSRNKGEPGGTTRLLIISATAVDSTGKPLKL